MPRKALLIACALLLLPMMISAQSSDAIRYFPPGTRMFIHGEDSPSLRYVLPTATLKTGLSAYWALGEASGNRADSHGTNTLADSGATGNTAGKNGDAVQFGGTTYLSIADASQTGLDFTTAASFSFWIKDSAFATDKVIASKWAYATDGGYSIQTSAGGANDISMFIATSATDDGSGCQVRWEFMNMAINTWYHVAILYDGTQATEANRLKLYLNGSLQLAATFQGAVPTTMRNNAAVFALSFWPGLNRQISADIDEFAVWSRTLSEAHVTALYAAGAGKFYAAF